MLLSENFPGQIEVGVLGTLGRGDEVSSAVVETWGARFLSQGGVFSSSCSSRFSSGEELYPLIFKGEPMGNTLR